MLQYYMLDFWNNFVKKKKKVVNMFIVYLMDLVAQVDKQA